MNLECPSCHAAYDVPDDRLGSRRVVRCGTCDHKWAVGTRESVVAEPVGDDAAAAPPDDPVNLPAAPVSAVAGPDQRLAPALTVPQRDMALTGAWVASVAMIVLLVGAAYTWRGHVIAAWPPSARILGYAPKVAVLLDGHADTRVPADGGALGRHD
jgi:predicted Zn finger-like uncharacterized protein